MACNRLTPKTLFGIGCALQQGFDEGFDLMYPQSTPRVGQWAGTGQHPQPEVNQRIHFLKRATLADQPFHQSAQSLVPVFQAESLTDLFEGNSRGGHTRSYRKQVFGRKHLDAGKGIRGRQRRWQERINVGRGRKKS